MSNPLVSIITPVYNAEKYLRVCIDSVLNQIYPNWELLLIDDFSSDSSVPIIQTYTVNDNRIKLILLKTNSGAAIARNTGIEKANGKYIAFLDADDVWKNDKLLIQIPFMENSGCILSCSYYNTIAEDGMLANKLIKVHEIITYKQLLKNNTIGCLTAVYNAEKLGKQYMPNIRKRQDYGLWLSILSKGHTAYGIQQSLAYYRITKASLSANKIHVLKYNWLLLRKYQHLNFFTAAYYFLCFIFNKALKYVS